MLDCVLNRINTLRSDIDLFFEKYKKEFEIINQSNMIDNVDAIIDEYSKKNNAKIFRRRIATDL